MGRKGKRKKAAEGRVKPQDDRVEVLPVSGADLAVWKKVLFSAILTLGFFAFLEAGLGVLGFQPPQGNDPYVGFSGSSPLFVPGDGAAMETAPEKLRFFNPQSFPAKKPPGTYRIFCMGGSTTYGRPYTDPVSFCGWLRELLPAADPSRRWELINAGGISYASYRVAVLMEELAGYDSDLFIVYSGHNEFLERRTYGLLATLPRPLMKAAAMLSRTRIFAAGKRLAKMVRGGAPSTGGNALPAEVDARLDRSVGPEDYARKDLQTEKTFEHHRYNLERMADTARAAGAKILFISPASNLKDCPPFKSEPSAALDAGERRRLEDALADAKAVQATGDLDGALRLLSSAAEFEQHYSSLDFLRGKLLYSLGRFDEAKAAFQNAVDEDVCPLRAPSGLRRIVMEAAAAKGAPFVDFAAKIESRSPHGIPGSELFLDHVHLSSAGYRMLAFDIMKELARDGIIPPLSAWDASALRTAEQRVERGIDKKAQGVAMRNLAKVMLWAGRSEQAQEMARRANDLTGGDPASFVVLGSAALRRKDFVGAVRSLNRALELQPGFIEAHFLLGRALQEQERSDAAIEQFSKTLELFPGHSAALAGLAVELGKEGRWGEALPLLEAAVEKDPRSVRTRFNLCLALASSGTRRPEAVGCLRQALSLRPDFVPALVELGRVLASQGLLVEASRHLKEAVRLAPASSEPHDELGRVLAARGDFRAAEEHLRQASHLLPGSADIHNQLGRVLAAQGQRLKAEAQFIEALRIAPEHSRARLNLEKLSGS